MGSCPFLVFMGTKELWRPIKGYENYSISTHGNVRRYRTYSSFYYKGKDRFVYIKGMITIKGYHMKGVCKNGTKRNIAVHRLVAEHFIPNPQNLPQVNHIDGNKLNNHISNLEWVTASENILHSVRIGLRKPKDGRTYHNSRMVINLESGVFFETLRDAFNSQNEFSYKFLSMMLNGKYRNKTKFLYL